MAWNEPGGDNKDPWGNRNEKGPPDLDELLQKVQKGIGGIFGGRGGRGSGGRGSGPKLGSGAVSGIIALIVIGWVASGIFLVQPAERGVVTQFGRYLRTATPGPNWHIPWPVQSVQTVNVDQNQSYRLRNQTMLTQDENIVDIDIAVQWNIKSAEDFLFKVRDPAGTVEQVAESAIREVVGKNDMDFILKEGRDVVAEDTYQRMQTVLDNYATGINVQTVNLERAQPPQAVQEAFDDANKAREDRERFINEAEAYANGIIPVARGDARRMLEEAKGYRTRVVKAAEGESRRFLDLLQEYRKAPEITRDRLYLEAVETVLSNSSKVMIDVEGGNNLMYLPLDAILRNSGGGVRSSTPGSFDSQPFEASQPLASRPSNSSDPRRSRETRQ